MKKYLLVLLTIFLAYSVSAQWSFGPRTGLNFSTISGEGRINSDDKNWIGGFEVGGFANYAIADNFLISTEILYINSGTQYNWSHGSSQSIDAYLLERYGNLRIPIYAKYMRGKDFKFYGIFGPYFDFILCGKYKRDILLIDNNLKGKIKFGDKPNDYNGNDLYINENDRYNVRRFDVGMNLGIGVQHEMGFGSLGLELRFGMGFLDFFKFYTQRHDVYLIGKTTENTTWLKY